MNEDTVISEDNNTDRAKTEIWRIITRLEGDLRAIISLSPLDGEDRWLLELNLYYRNEPAGKTSFNLEGHTQAEAREVAQTVNQNSFIMKEIDEFLWGESD